MQGRKYRIARRKFKNLESSSGDEYFTPEWEGPKTFQRASRRNIETPRSRNDAIRNIDMTNVLESPVIGAEAPPLPIEEMPLPEWHYVPKHGLRPKKRKKKKQKHISPVKQPPNEQDVFMDEFFKTDSECDPDDELAMLMESRQNYKNNVERRRASSVNRIRNSLYSLDRRVVQSNTELDRLEQTKSPIPEEETNKFDPDVYNRTRQLRRYIYHNVGENDLDYDVHSNVYNMRLPCTVEELDEYYPANRHLEALLQNIPEYTEYIPPEKFTMGMPINPHFAPYVKTILEGKPIEHPYKFDREKMIKQDREYRAKMKEKMIDKRKEDEEMFKLFGFPHPDFDKHIEMLEGLKLVNSWIKD